MGLRQAPSPRDVPSQKRVAVCPLSGSVGRFSLEPVFIKAEDMHMSWFVKSRNADDQPVNAIHCNTPQKVCEMYQDQQNMGRREVWIEDEDGRIMDIANFR